ncbi:MAG: HAD family hydrolase, partial [Bacteroidales bacterium]|nr:HAD family hydrolase [Bacteroidales bacterium]
MTEKKPTIALIYDFDGTLSPGNMQEYDFLEEVGIKDKEEFWRQNDEDALRNNASSLLCGMQLILEKSRAARKPIIRGTFQKYGHRVEYYKGVAEWFDLINKFGEKEDLNIEHYIISSGLKEMVEGTTIAKYFKQIFASTFLYDENGAAYWPAVAVDFTAKVQFLWMINKGVSKISDNSDINKFVPDNERPVPFNHMIYLGDGFTDVP